MDGRGEERRGEERRGEERRGEERRGEERGRDGTGLDFKLVLYDGNLTIKIRKEGSMDG